MKEFRDYDILYPELIYDILDYFRVGNGPKAAKDKSILDYCETSRFSRKGQNPDLIQPDTVHTICEILAKKNYLQCTKAGLRIGGYDSNYIFMPQDPAYFLKKDPAMVFMLNCVTYGFRYIYATYRNFVLPIIVKKNEQVSMGTCFRFHRGIVTAKHCIEVDEVCIVGYSAEKLKQGKVLVAKDPSIDLAYIDLGELSPLLAGEAKVLDDVLVMGYPRIPMFFDFCAAERATISSIPTCGAVASIADQYVSRNVGPLMLVTARIRGGNSGGPIIDSDGAVVGVAFSEPKSEGSYDEMGYGVAYPIHVLNQVLQDPDQFDVNFVDNVN